jgi:xanthine dehydrogenase accessory factor
VNSAFALLRDCLRSDQPVVLATVVEVGGAGPDLALPPGLPPAPEVVVGAKLVVRPGSETVGSLGDQRLDDVVARDALGALDTGSSTTRHYGGRGEALRSDVTVFLDVFAPSRRMVIFGAVDFTGALARMAKVLGYRVTVCDARATFATARRFPDADEVVVEWPQAHLARVGPQLGPRDAICVLTHDQKFDVPAILAALQTQVGYLGAMGSRRTHAARVERLRAAGADEAALARVMAPIGIDIGARTPEETAIAICAEIIARRSHAPVSSLRDGSGPIHRTVPAGPLLPGVEA